MSFSISHDELSPKEIDEICKKYTIHERRDPYTPEGTDPPAHYVFRNDNSSKCVWLPLRAWKDYYDEFPNKIEFEYTPLRIENNTSLYTAETDPTGRGRDQQNVAKQALATLRKDHSILLSLHTGFGKSLTSIYIACKLGYKVAILCHNNTLKRQFKESFEKYTSAKVQTVMGQKPLDPKADVYIIGIIKASKMSRKEIQKAGIGTVIIDEVQLVTKTAFSVSIPLFSPLYLIGLSATPDRKDGMHKLLYPYFGPKKSFITRFEVKNFRVIKYETPFKPEIEYTLIMGQMRQNPNTKRISIESNKRRHKFIADIALAHPEHRIIILCERVIQIEALAKLFKESGADYDTFYGTQKSYRQGCQILVAGIKKGGVGMDDPTLTMLILASYTDDVRQLEGRIRTTDNLIYHIVDNHKSFETKWNKCKQWYLKRGATVEMKGWHTKGVEPGNGASEEQKEPPRPRYLGRNNAPLK